MVLPGVIIKETVESARKEGYTGRNILVIGNAGYATEKCEEKVYTLYNYDDAMNELAPPEKVQSPGRNILKNIIRDIFNEGKPLDPNDTFGLNKVYAINIGPNATIQTLLTALETSETVYDADIEVYPELSDIPAMNMIKGHLKKLEGFGDYRIALMAASPNASIDEMTKMTDPNESVYINSGRVIIQANPNVLGAFAAKVACTPYYQDPAYNPYRTIITQDIRKYRRDELETILDAGLVVDWEVVVDSTLGMKVVEPVYAPATNYTSEATPGDAWLHHRLNADHQSKITDGKARPYIKQNNTENCQTSNRTKMQITP